MKNALLKIKEEIKKNNWAGVFVSRQDSFLGEYYAPYKKRLENITGFTGSAGLALITQDEDILFVDSRYTTQAKKQSNFKVYEVPTETTVIKYITNNLKSGQIMFDGWVHSHQWYEALSKLLLKIGIELKQLNPKTIENWFGVINEQQNQFFEYKIKYAGETTEEKLIKLTAEIKKHQVKACIITKAENTSWLLNRRAKEKTEYPVVYERGIVDDCGNYTPYSIENLKKFKDEKVMVDYSNAPLALIEEIESLCKTTNIPECVDFMKAEKNSVEIKNIKKACLSESKTICSFLAWVEENKRDIDELDCDEKLKELRSNDKLYFADSFQTIVASGEHAASAHYTATKETSCAIINNPILLVDTGGHYLNGTTDMTRTIAILKPTEMMKKRYTQVLKGHIALATSHIKEGETTQKIDRKAHQYLRKDKVDYLHSTGHGIGMMLGVHEMPPIIHEKDPFGLKAGMVFSNEPAYYDEQAGFGIRLENMLLSEKTKKGTLKFENLLYIPFDYRLVDFGLLTQKEKKWLSQYHKKIKTKVFKNLNENEQKILLPFIEAFQI